MILAALAVAVLTAAAVIGATTRTGTASAAEHEAHSQSSGCKLDNGIKHVIYLQFDNTHLFRDRQQFASDLEQMPHLMNFLSGNGTLSDNEHTILISHTAGGILSSLTGLYPDRMGQAVSNSYRYFKANGSTASSSSFKYWTDLTDGGNPADTPPTPSADPSYNMVNGDSGTAKNTPAPWVPWARAGCDVGNVSTANAVLENNNSIIFKTGSTTEYATDPTGDMTKVFGEGSPEWNDGKASQLAPFGTAARAKALTDYVGIAIHCGAGGGICKGNPNARPDLLPDEPGGYAGFEALFGAKYVNPAINGGAAAVNDTSGAPITDPFGQPGFPGFDGVPAKVSLGYVAQMQEAGVPVTFAYISDAHDNHTNAFPAPPDPTGTYPRASGPGETDYVQALHDYDAAFATFFTRLARDGITRHNTMFVVTADENDHFAGGNSTDGTWSHTYCNLSVTTTCPANQIGEVNANLVALLPSGESTFFVHSDSAPTVYVNGNPVRTDSALRKLERDAAAVQVNDPYVSSSKSPLTLYLADTIGEKTLHMVTADPQRTPTFTLFANPDFFITASTTSNPRCGPPGAPFVPVCIDPHFAWSHGDATDDIGRTWLGLAGPGIRELGQTSSVWTDHTDIQPTMLALAGLKNDYGPDGRVITEFTQKHALPKALRKQRQALTELGLVYKEINAPFGPLSFDVLAASTRALASGSATDDATYTAISDRITALTDQRNTLAGQMRDVLNNAAFGGPSASASEIDDLIQQGNSLLMRANQLGAGSSP
ncbi:MAG: hypothetical protein M3O73_08700 [Actinomycetota bacterium]|nr:hypothetical protein [Actinomycetota bacterium]